MTELFAELSSLLNDVIIGDWWRMAVEASCLLCDLRVLHVLYCAEAWLDNSPVFEDWKYRVWGWLGNALPPPAVVWSVPSCTRRHPLFYRAAAAVEICISVLNEHNTVHHGWFGFQCLGKKDIIKFWATSVQYTVNNSFSRELLTAISRQSFKTTCYIGQTQ